MSPKEVEGAKAGHWKRIAEDRVAAANRLLERARAAEATIQTQASEIEGLKHQVLGRAQEAWKAEQIAGAVLGYPWFKDDQGSFPGATEADGVCIGEHVTSTIVEELADKTKALQSALDEALEVMRPFADVAASYTAGGLSEDLRHGPTLVTESGHLEKLAPKHFFTLRSLYDRLKGRTGA